MKVVTNTIKEICISNFYKTSFEQLTKSQAVRESSLLYWCNGILFQYDIHSSDDLITGLARDGLLCISNFSYIEYEKIEQAKWNGYAIEVLDETGDPIAEKITESIKESES